mgnify:CR=1 FL=1
MKRVARRQVLASLGLFAGTGVLTGCPSSSRPPRRDQKDGSQSHQWAYVELTPELVAKKAYELFPHGGCMYGVAGGIITMLDEQVGEPYRSFPLEMMRYGAGGTAGWGALCGALNGSAAIIGLLQATKQSPLKRLFGGFEKPAWYKSVGKVFTWYEGAELPTYQPEDTGNPPHIASSVAGSVLCHVSLNNWCESSGHKALGPKRVERCRRLTADVAMKTVEVLNEGLKGTGPSDRLSPSVQSCNECHGREGLKDSMGKMNCSACHELPEKHPQR